MFACTREDGRYDIGIDWDDSPEYYLRNISWEEVVDLMTRFSEGEDFSYVFDSWEMDKGPWITKTINFLILTLLLIGSAVLVISLTVLIIFLVALIIFFIGK